MPWRIRLVELGWLRSFGCVHLFVLIVLIVLVIAVWMASFPTNVLSLQYELIVGNDLSHPSRILSPVFVCSGRQAHHDTGIFQYTMIHPGTRLGHPDTPSHILGTRNTSSHTWTHIYHPSYQIRNTAALRAYELTS